MRERARLTTILLIRHASYPAIGERLVGRAPGIHLDARGRAEAQRLAIELARVPIQAIYSSPLDRAIETAEPLARRLLLPVRIAPELIDVDAGAWTGCRFDALDQDRTWQTYNAHRSRSAPPDGESMRRVTRRVIGMLTRLRARHVGDVVAAVTHGDVIRAARLHYERRDLDELHAVEVPPASVTCLKLAEYPLQRSRSLRRTCMPSAHPVTNHEEIRSWVERHDGHPATVKGRHGLLRIDFGEPEESLEPMQWDEWFDVFDDRGLAALIPPDEDSRFFKLVNRETVGKH